MLHNIIEVYKMNDLNGMPQGFGMALSRNAKAMNTFSILSEEEKTNIDQ